MNIDKYLILTRYWDSLSTVLRKNPLNNISIARTGAAKLIAMFTFDDAIEIRWPMRLKIKIMGFFIEKLKNNCLMKVNFVLLK